MIILKISIFDLISTPYKAKSISPDLTVILTYEINIRTLDEPQIDAFWFVVYSHLCLNVIQVLGIKLTEDEVHLLLSEIDTGYNGQLELQDYLQVIHV